MDGTIGYRMPATRVSIAAQLEAGSMRVVVGNTSVSSIRPKDLREFMVANARLCCNFIDPPIGKSSACSVCLGMHIGGESSQVCPLCQLWWHPSCQESSDVGLSGQPRFADSALQSLIDTEVADLDPRVVIGSEVCQQIFEYPGSNLCFWCDVFVAAHKA
jgi:hypothetical protein